MSDSLNAMVAEFEKAQASLSATARDTRGKAIQAKEAEYSAERASCEQKAQTAPGGAGAARSWTG